MIVSTEVRKEKKILPREEYTVSGCKERIKSQNYSITLDAALGNVGTQTANKTEDRNKAERMVKWYWLVNY